jgi:hypothetical protein
MIKSLCEEENLEAGSIKNGLNFKIHVEDANLSG